MTQEADSTDNTNNTDKAAIEAVIKKYSVAFNARDIETIMECYTPDAVAMIVEGQLLESLEAIRAGVLDTFTGGFRTELEGIESLVSGDAALAVVQATIRGSLPDGTKLEFKSRRSLDVLRRQPDGSWLVAIDDGPGTDLLTSLTPT